MFKNEPFTDFSVESNRNALSAALEKLTQQVSNRALSATPIIDGKQVGGGEELASIDPSDGKTVLGKVYLATNEMAEAAVTSLAKGAIAWRNKPLNERVEIIRKCANIMLEQRHDIVALIIREAGKPWAEADGDFAEAVDFCNYYADEMLRLGEPQRMGNIAGEENIYFYQPRGVGVVIAPWNFPFAIACGMTVAGLVTGNGVILKPAEQTSLVAAKLAQILYDAGVPGNAFCFLPGWGEQVGAYLVAHPKVDFICFTGSKAVGLEIIRQAANTKPGQENVKRVVAEMGGKNCIIVDSDADMDEAIKGVIRSAFGYAGQKCSACSRAIIVESAYSVFIDRLVRAAEDIIVGPAHDSSTFLSPVIDREAHDKIRQAITSYSQESTLCFSGKVPENGYFIPATIFKDVTSSARIWNEEIFGPVLACAKAKDFSSAIEMANDCEYALTGGLYSRSPKNIATAKAEFRVGNLYVNRPITGALVYRQPFGGFKMSGIGSKAGGPDYLIQFMEPRTITENTMRRGFVPE